MVRTWMSLWRRHIGPRPQSSDGTMGRQITRQKNVQCTVKGKFRSKEEGPVPQSGFLAENSTNLRESKQKRNGWKWWLMVAHREPGLYTIWDPNPCGNMPANPILLPPDQWWQHTPRALGAGAGHQYFHLLWPECQVSLLLVSPGKRFGACLLPYVSDFLIKL